MEGGGGGEGWGGEGGGGEGGGVDGGGGSKYIIVKVQTIPELIAYPCLLTIHYTVIIKCSALQLITKQLLLSQCQIELVLRILSLMQDWDWGLSVGYQELEIWRGSKIGIGD